MVGGKPEPPGGFPKVVRHAAALREHRAQVELRIGAALLRREPVPAHGLDVVAGDAPSFAVHESEVVLRGWMPLSGCEPIPPNGLGGVAEPFGVDVAEMELRDGVSALSCETVPVNRLSRVSPNATALVVHPAKVELGVDFILFGSKGGTVERPRYDLEQRPHPCHT